VEHSDKSAEGAPDLGKIVSINEGRVKEHLDSIVRGTVEETLNALLDAEADQLCAARRYERTEARKDTRAGHYTRALETKAGPVELKVPKLRSLPFETAIIERYKRRESSVEEALVEMYLVGVSVRRLEDITDALWGKRVSPSTVSELNRKIYTQIEAWRSRSIEGEQLRTNNPLERILREIRRRTRVVGSFPDGESAVMLAAARLRHVAEADIGPELPVIREHRTLVERRSSHEAVRFFRRGGDGCFRGGLRVRSRASRHVLPPARLLPTSHRRHRNEERPVEPRRGKEGFAARRA
jgi:hypothetical protein